MIQLFALIFDSLPDVIHSPTHASVKSPDDFPFCMQSFSKVHCIPTHIQFRHLSPSVNANMALLTYKGLALLWNLVPY